MSDHNELVAQFIEISGGDENVARFYLASSNWSLEDALSNFLGNQSEGESTVPNLSESNAATDDNIPELPSGSRGQIAGNGSSTFQKRTWEKPKFATLTDMTQRPEDEEEGQAFYAGGSERSGQQVLGPPRRRNFREQLTDMFRMAQDNNSGEASPGPSNSGDTSWGQGVRLGMTDTDHTVVTPLSGEKKSGEKKPVVVLKLWSQGFSIDDGELRQYDNPENKEFLETVMRGEIPHELLEMGWMVNVDVEDHRHEEYKQRGATSLGSFKGSGHTLGSPAPDIESEATPATTNSANIAGDENVAKEKLNLSPGEPTTTLQIRLGDGSRLTAQFNLTHTVADIQQYIQNARPQYANRNFVLVSSFPTRELTDESATIEGAGLKNASLMQRFK